jgi:hypothetical protein
MNRFVVRHRSFVLPTSIEPLEDRRLLSGTLATPADVTPVVIPIDVNLTTTAGKKFRDLVATWNVDGGLPTRASGNAASATIDWGDGKTSHGKFVDDGSGVVQIIGSHAWKHEGTFDVVVTVNEFPRKHKHDITQIGVANDTAVVSPKPHKISVKGSLTGTYTIPLGGNPDARSYVFTGAGMAKALGNVTVDGHITPPGFITSAPATGELTLTGATGSVTLSLTGAVQEGGSPLPQKMSYEITGGTGDFPSPGGHGSISIAVDDTALTFVIVIH